MQGQKGTVTLQGMLWSGYVRGAHGGLVDGVRQRGDSIWLGLGGHSGFWSGRARLQFAHHYLSDPEPEASKIFLEASKMPDEPFVAS